MRKSNPLCIADITYQQESEHIQKELLALRKELRYLSEIEKRSMGMSTSLRELAVVERIIEQVEKRREDVERER